MEEKIEIETPSGKMEITVGGPLSIKQRKTLNSILGGKREHVLDLNGNPTLAVRIEELYDSQFKLVEFCVKSPEVAKKPEFIESLGEYEFNKLRQACDRVTAQDMKTMDTREKKSESPSSVESSPMK
jgi:hypothetical protein